MSRQPKTKFEKDMKMLHGDNWLNEIEKLKKKLKHWEKELKEIRKNRPS